MDDLRQQVFRKLRSPCVELSSTTLKFKANLATVKEVSHALELQHAVLQDLADQNHLDAKLAEYAFFPLTHVFNQSQKLSAHCLEHAARSVIILVSHGWRRQLVPELGKQLLVLMSLLAGDNSHKQTQPATDELKCAAFDCIAVTTHWLSQNPTGAAVFANQSTKSLVDQLVFLLVESLTESPSDHVQLSASKALFELYLDISDRVLLASLLPRTVSSLTKALKVSTQARRTTKVLCANLKLLLLVLKKVLADEISEETARDTGSLVKDDADTLDASWLRATAAQIKNALIQVTKLRNSEKDPVRQALAELCVMVIEDCSHSLPDCMALMLETLVILSGGQEENHVSTTLKTLFNSRPELQDLLQTSFYDWSQSLPRVMQGNHDRPKELMLMRISNSFNLLTRTNDQSDSIVEMLTTTLLRSIESAVGTTVDSSVQIQGSGSDLASTVKAVSSAASNGPFEAVLFQHESQKSSAEQLRILLTDLRQSPAAGNIARAVVDTVGITSGSQKTAAIWLALQMLKKDGASVFDLEDMIMLDHTSHDRNHSRSYMVHDLYSFTKEYLTDSSPSPLSDGQTHEWQLTALSLEVLVLQAQQLGVDYRNELFETLYPVLSLLGIQISQVQNHAITALNLLTSACHYSSTTEMLVENVDYLVNSIAWKLNTFSLSPEAPQVLTMMVRLVGARLIPYLDDLIAAIFAALDNYHGYTTWVEMLFTALKAIVDEGTRQPRFAIADQAAGTDTESAKQNVRYRVSSISDVLADLRARKRRKLHSRSSPPSSPDADADADAQARAPHRPWNRQSDDPTHKPVEDEEISLESLLAQQRDDEGDFADSAAATTTEKDKKEEEKDPTQPVSKTHSLLLRIAESTVPHLSSPSPRVRHVLLQLLVQITPLLARHENTFLPLVNAVWPAVVIRLFSSANAKSTTQLDETLTTMDNNDRETNYNVSAAADVVRLLCEHAGNFMSSRVESIMSQLLKLFHTTLTEVEATKTRHRRTQHGASAATATATNTGFEPKHPTGSADTTSLSGVVNLSIVPQSTTTTTAAVDSTSISSTSRTGASQLLTSLVPLLTTILSSAGLSAESASPIFEALVPFVTSSLYNSTTLGQQVRQCMQEHNPDLLWLVIERAKMEDEMEQGIRDIQDRKWMDNPVETVRPVVF